MSAERTKSEGKDVMADADRVPKRLGMGLVGPGFVGAHHLDAVRRLGFVDIVALADDSDDLATRRARQYGVPKAYGDYEALAADPAIDVVHVTTPNFLHAPVIRAAIAHGKHVISEKPLAMTAEDARDLRDAAEKAGVVHAVTFNYRGNPMVQQARAMVDAGEIGAVHFIHGAYLQDWLLEATDYSWRLEPDKGGRSSAFADIGSHWCDLAQHVSGLRIESVLAELATVVSKRLRPAVSSTFGQENAGEREEVVVTCEDLATVLLRFEGGGRGCVTIGQVCAGHKNDLWFEVNGGTGSLRWRQEQQNELWVGSRARPNAVLTKDPTLMHPAVRPYVHLPGGHQQGWSDALANVFRDVYTFIGRGQASAERPPAFATFDDGYRAACVVEAILASQERGGAWTKATY